jgi:hypothetical protein
MKDKLNELLRNVMKLLAARDKVLWEGEAGKGDVIHIPGMKDYRLLAAHTQAGSFIFDPSTARVGGELPDSVGDDRQLTHVFFGYVGLSDEKLTVSECRLFEKGNPIGQSKITKIIGIEPIRAKILSGSGGS